MGESKRHKLREDEFKTKLLTALYAPGMTLLGGWADDEKAHAEIIVNTRAMLSVPNLSRPAAERMKAEASFERHVSYDGPGTYMFDLSGKRVHPRDLGLTEPLVKITNTVHVAVTGQARGLVASIAQGGPGADVDELKGMLRLDATGAPIAPCDLPLCSQLAFLANAAIGSESPMPEDHFFHLRRISGTPEEADIVNDDDAWADLSATARGFLGYASDPSPNKFLVNEIRESARVAKAVQRSSIKGIAHKLGISPYAWSRIDDDLKGNVWRLALESMTPLVGAPVPGRNAMMTHVDLRSLQPDLTRERLLSGAEPMMGARPNELWRYPDGRLLFLGERETETTIIVWHPDEGPSGIADPFRTHLLHDIDLASIPRPSLAETAWIKDLGLYKFLPNRGESGCDVALLKAHMAGATLADLLATLAQIAARPDRPQPNDELDADTLWHWRARTAARDVAEVELGHMAKATGGRPREDLYAVLLYLRDALDDTEDAFLGLAPRIAWPAIPDLEEDGRRIRRAIESGANLVHVVHSMLKVRGLPRIHDWITPRDEDRPLP